MIFSHNSLTYIHRLTSDFGRFTASEFQNHILHDVPVENTKKCLKYRTNLFVFGVNSFQFSNQIHFYLNNYQGRLFHAHMGVLATLRSAELLPYLVYRYRKESP